MIDGSRVEERQYEPSMVCVLDRAGIRSGGGGEAALARLLPSTLVIAGRGDNRRDGYGWLATMARTPLWPICDVAGRGFSGS